MTRVEVSRDGVRVREATLDPERTGLQTIPVEGTGGVWRVRVTGLAPGTQRAWRAARVSELRVMGVAAPLRRAPQVWVAPSPLGRDRAAVAIEGPYGSDESFCEALRDEDPERCRPPATRTIGCAGVSNPSRRWTAPRGRSRSPRRRARCGRRGWSRCSGMSTSATRARFW